MDKEEFDEFVRKVTGDIKEITDEKLLAQLRALDNDPVVIEKNREAEEALKRNPIPEWLVKKVQGSE